jgi:hypothetical protein
LNNKYYLDIFIKNFKRVFIYNSNNLNYKEKYKKNLLDLKIIENFDFDRFELQIIQNTQNINLKKQFKKELETNFE